MGVGDALMGVLGGKNNYDYQFSPLIGSHGEIIDRNSNLNNKVNQAQNIRLPQNVLNFGANRGESAQQQALIDQILAQGRGEGPNPALQQLNLTTDQNARQGNALIASQRGINPALAARMAGQNVANVNQQAVGQGALMSAQQQLGSQQLGGNLLGQRIGQQSQNAVSQGQAGLGLLGARLGAEQARRQAQQNYEQMINNVYGQANQVNSGVSAQNAQTAGGLGAGIMSGVSGALGFNEGGQVQNLASGGSADSFYAFQGNNPQSSFLGTNPGLNHSMGTLSKDLASKLDGLFQSPMDTLNPQAGDGQFSPGSIPTTNPFDPRTLSAGGKVLGKAEKQGDSMKNDTVPAMLSPGEVVIPRTAMKNAESAHDFLDKIIQKHDGPRYGDIVKAKEHYHNLAHGGEMNACAYCSGGKVGY